MKPAVQRVQRINSQLQDAISLCASSKNKRHLIAALSTSTSECETTLSWLVENEKRKYVGVRKAIAAVRNVCAGLVEGLTNNEIAPSEFREVVANLSSKFAPAIQAALDSEPEDEASTVASHKPVISEQVRLAIKNSPDAIVAAFKAPKYESDSSKSELEELGDQARSQLPVKIAREFQVVRVPIVPLFPNPMAVTDERLTRLGLDFVNIETVVVLKKQILVLVSKKKAHAAGQDALDFVYGVIDVLNEKGTKYDLVSDKGVPNPRNTDLMMYWVLPSNRLSALMKLIGTSKATIIRWGLPMAADTAEYDAATVVRKERESVENDIANVPKAAKLLPLVVTKKVSGMLKEADVRIGQTVHAFLDSVKRRIGLSTNGTTVQMWIPVDGQGLRVFINFSGFSDFIKANRVTNRVAMSAFNMSDADMANQEKVNKESLHAAKAPEKAAREEAQRKTVDAKKVRIEQTKLTVPTAKPLPKAAKPLARPKPNSASPDKLAALVKQNQSRRK